MERVVWQRLQATGTLTCSRDKADSDPLFQQAYAWMRGAMAGAGIEAPAPGLSPRWSWIRREPERGMPHAEDLEGLDDPVVLQLAVPAGDLVPSCFDLWHYVLNRWYVADSEEDALDFEGLQAVYEGPSRRRDCGRHGVRCLIWTGLWQAWGPSRRRAFRRAFGRCAVIRSRRCWNVMISVL